MIQCNETHDPKLASWVHAANAPESEFPIQNLPFGLFTDRKGGKASVGIAIGDQIVDLTATLERGLLSGKGEIAATACRNGGLVALMALGQEYASALRFELSGLLCEGTPQRHDVELCLVAMSDVQMRLPEPIANFTDFATSVNHVGNLGRMFMPGSPIRDNFKYLPTAYHGRASSLVVSGTRCRRPLGQFKPQDSSAPQFGPTRQLDFELEVGFYVGFGNRLWEAVPLAAAAGHVFGLCLVNDWSARDVLAWEMQPLGPFLGKSFLTSVSPWIVTLEALAPFRVAAAERAADDPPLLPHLRSEVDRLDGGIDIALEVWLQSRAMRDSGIEPVKISEPRFADQYWTIFQMLSHHTSNGCNLVPGDLIASGTVSGPRDNELGCLLEAVAIGAKPITLPNGEERRFLEDGDEIVFRGRCKRAGFRTIGFGECRGIVEAASA